MAPQGRKWIASGLFYFPTPITFAALKKRKTISAYIHPFSRGIKIGALPPDEARFSEVA
jgi:hypothetical protein